MTDVLTDYFNGLTKSLLSTLNTPEDYLNKIALTAVVIIIGMFLHWLIKKFIIHNLSDFTKKYTLNKIIKNTLTTLIVLFILFIWIQAINALILIGLTFGVFIVVMVRGLINNIIGFAVIKYRKYFKVGHRVEINDIIGDVIEINPISFELLEVRKWLSSDSNTGRIIKLPNRIIFQESIEMIGVVNTFVWQEIKYVLSFDSDWQDAERIMTEVGELHFEEFVLPEIEGNNDHLLGNPEQLRPAFSLNTNDDGIILILRYLVDYRQGTKVKTHLQRNILKKFNDNPEIKFAVLDMRILPE